MNASTSLLNSVASSPLKRWLMQPATMSFWFLCFFFSPFASCASMMASMLSSFAESMNAQVFTMSTSA